METLNKVASAASEAIWGKTQSHEEPVSGKMGNVDAGEPYDAGNIGEPNEAALSSTTTTTTTGTSAPQPMPKPDPEAATKPRFVESTTSHDEINPTTTTTTTTGTSAPQPMPKPDPEAVTKPRFVDSTTSHDETNPTTSPSTSSSQPSNPAGPAKFAPSSLAMRDDSTKAQSDTRPPPPASDQCESHAGTETKTAAGAAGIADIKRDTSTTTPAGGAAAAAARGDAAKPKEEEDATTLEKPASDSKEKGKDAKDKGEEQEVKIEGPGPRPLEEIAREHGGDAGLARQGGGSSSGAGSGLLGEAESAGVGAGAGAGAAGSRAGVETAGVETGAAGSAAGQNRRDSGKSLGGESGTGEEYVKSSGFSADGGDFDASRPGAGREADRLLEVKGVHKGAEDAHGSHEKHGGHGIHGIPGLHGSHGSHAAHGNATGTETAPKEKVGLKEKIKAKLHKGSTSS